MDTVITPDIESIERATVAAVAPERLDEQPGWLLPMDSGTVGRARSAVPLHHAAQPLERLDAIVREARGRLYPAKDARMPRALFEAGYPRLSEFLTYRDPGISSGLSRRLMGT